MMPIGYSYSLEECRFGRAKKASVEVFYEIFFVCHLVCVVGCVVVCVLGYLMGDFPILSYS